MNKKMLDVLCDPKAHAPLTFNGDSFTAADGTVYSIKNEIPVLMQQSEIAGLNLKYQRFYDMIAKGYDIAFWIYTKFHKDGVAKRRELLRDLVITPGMKVLETSIGTGFNVSLFTKEAEYHGMDISMGMLEVCQRENEKRGYDLHIVQANAEELPYKDNSFDLIFHVGGINFFSDIPKAINEMIRVAKPGAQIALSDETQEAVDKVYKRLPFVRRFFKDAAPVAVPMEHIPAGMKDVTLRYAEDKRMYVITFAKPF